MDGIVTNAENIISQMSNGLIPVSIFYIGLNALITLILAIMVVKARVQTKTIIGDGGDEIMIRAMRAHGNNVEYVPLSLIVIAAVEMAAAPIWFIHALGAGLTIARVAHAAGMHQTTGSSLGRLVGTITNNTVLLAGSLACIYYGLS